MTIQYLTILIFCMARVLYNSDQLTSSVVYTISASTRQSILSKLTILTIFNYILAKIVEGKYCFCRGNYSV